MVRKQVFYHLPRNRGLGMPDQENHWFAERLAYLGWSLSTGAVWRRKARKTLPRFMSNSKAEGWRRPRDKALFVRKCWQAPGNLPGSSDLSRFQKELYREIVVGSASNPLVDRLEWSMEEVRSHWNWVPGSVSLNSSRFSLTFFFCLATGH